MRVDGTVSGSCPIMDFRISSVESSGSTIRNLVMKQKYTKVAERYFQKVVERDF
jgi:hypothetical protein